MAQISVNLMENLVESALKILYERIAQTWPLNRLNFFPLSDIMDLRHQSSAMCIIMFIMLGGEDTHP